MNNKHQELIAEKVAEFNKIFNTENVWQGEDDWTKNVPIGNLEQWLAQTLQDTIDTVLEEERKRVNNNIELLACKVDERRMGAHGREIIKLKTLDKTPPNKV